MANDHIADDRKKVRLIDANEALRMIVNSKVDNPFQIIRGQGEIWKKAHDCVIDCVKNAPTVDAVEVVRCEKCKHYQQYHKGRTEELCEWGKCKLISMDVDMPCNGFCCFGERRTE